MGGPFLAAIGLQVVVPVSLPRTFWEPVIVLLGAALVVTGLAFIVLARRELARHGLPTGKLVTTGVFAASRNPLYLGGICLSVVVFFVMFLAFMRQDWRCGAPIGKKAQTREANITIPLPGWMPAGE